MNAQAITRDTADAIEAELLAKHGIFVLRKEGLPATIVGAGFDVARLFAPNLPTGEAFNSRFSTTLPLIPIEGFPGGLMLVPPDESHLTPAERLFRTAHEAKHVYQTRNPAPKYDRWAWGALYVSSQEFRAAQEAGGYLVNLALEWAVTGQVPDHEKYAHAITNNYALTADDHRLVSDLLELDAYSISQGIIRCGISRYVMRRLYELQPDALTEAARTVAKGI